MPFVLPPLFVFALGAMGAAVVVRWAVQEARRVNADLDRVREDEPGRDALPTLKRDPATGEYRPS